MRKLSATAAREGGAKAPARNGMTTGLEGHRSAPSWRRTRRPDNGRGEGAAPGDGANAAIGAAMDAAVNAATASVTVTETGRSDERRVGKECVSKCRSRGSTYHSNKSTNI